jgi:hypothetical protein
MGTGPSIDHWNCFTESKIDEYLAKALERKRLPILSIGSGDGFGERNICERFLKKDNPIEIVCVDNLSYPNTVNSPNLKQPDFATVNDLIASKPEVIGNCILLLFWSYDEARNPQDRIPYDIEAIDKLKPNEVITLYEEFGGAGGNLFHAWLKNSGAPTDHPSKYDDLDVNSIIPNYHLVDYNRDHYGTPDFLHFSEKSFIVARLSREKLT